MFQRPGSSAWTVRIELPSDGTQRRHYWATFDDKGAAVRDLDRVRHELNTGAFVKDDRATVGDFLAGWLATIRPSLRESTWDGYRRLVERHVTPRMGGVELRRVDGGTLHRLYAELGVNGRSERHGRRGDSGAGLSPRTIRHVHVLLKHALGDAVRWGRLARNPADQVDPPRASTSSSVLRTWSADELAAFFDRASAEGDELVPLWTFLATTGVRRGEALGLRWSDVDLEGGRARIVRAATVVAGDRHRLAFSEPKTSAGRRAIELDPGTVEVVRAHRAAQLEQRLLVGPGWRDLDLVFAMPDGAPLHPEAVYKRWRRRIARYGLPAIPLHGLRHTWATLALEADVHPRVVQERLGHSSIAVTLGIYSHVTRTMHREAAERVAALIAPRASRVQ